MKIYKVGFLRKIIQLKKKMKNREYSIKLFQLNKKIKRDDKLYIKNIIEYKLKLSYFRCLIQQQKSP